VRNKKKSQNNSLEKNVKIVTPDILEVFEGYKMGDWVHCLHCERYYKIGEFRIVKDRLVGDLQYCPYPDCDGDAIMDVIGVWQGEGEPIRGQIYPIVGF
jgi:hypothetical protein